METERQIANQRQSSLQQKQPVSLELAAVRKSPPVSLSDAVSRSEKALSSYLSEQQDKAVSLWIKECLIRTLTYLGAFDIVTEYQIEKLARRIQDRSYFMTTAELSYFFTAFEDGQYGKLYAGRSVNPQDIMQGLLQYQNSLLEARGDIEKKRRLEKEKEEHRKMKENAVTYEEYLKLIGKTPTPGEPNPLQRLQDSINKNKKR